MADGSAMNLPAYRVRVSQRAKNVSIHISHQGEVEVVVPQTFDLKQVPEIVSKRQDWITRTTQRLELERLTAPAPVTETLPKKITLRSLPEDWRVVYTPRRSHQLTASSTRNHQINLQGPTDNVAACQRVLQRWLSRKAQLHLVPWLRQVSQEVKLPCGSISVRMQKTLWASCSSKKAISLNAKLLFLPPHLVRYVFIHELCHTVHMNHSPRFWALVGEKEPDYERFDRELRKAWRYVPGWADGNGDVPEE